jgi:Flp pilus assembly pilin Flp
MKLFKFANFAKDESGAVTVDWVVLTAAIVGLGAVVMSTVAGGVNTVAGNIETELGKVTPYGTTASSDPAPQ